MKTMSLKIGEGQLKLLKAMSKATRIPQSALVRQGIELILLRAKEDVITPEFRKDVDAFIRENRSLLKRLADA